MAKFKINTPLQNRLDTLPIHTAHDGHKRGGKGHKIKRGSKKR